LAKITGWLLTQVLYFGYTFVMPRPPKKPEDRKDYHLRVPLTQAQRALVDAAAQAEGQEKAAWARTILLAAAKKQLGTSARPKKDV
jgi:hypothetical protein